MYYSKLAEIFGYITFGALAAYPFLKLNIRYALKFGLLDWPRARGMTQEQIPIIGYSLVILSLFAMGLIAYFFELSPWIIVTGSVVAYMGHQDDRRPLPPLEKLFWQTLCVAVVVAFDPHIQAYLGEKNGFIGYGISVLFIIGLMNAINFIDGIDGLAGTVIVMGALGFILFSSALTSHFGYVLLAGLTVGMFLPFLYMNLVKSKGFLGNIGSYFFGYVLAIMHLSIPMNIADPVARVSLNALCFLLPIADSVTVIATRIFSVRSPFQGDKGHLHHRLVQASLPLRYVLLNFGLISLTGITIAYFFNLKPAMHHSRLPVIICLAYVGIISLLIGMVEKASKRRIQSYFLRFDRREPVYFLKYRISRQDGKPLSRTALRRIEAKISSEIRVTDVCFAVGPDIMYVILNSIKEPVRVISGRVEPIFQKEKLHVVQMEELGQYVKLSQDQSKTEKKRVS